MAKGYGYSSLHQGPAKVARTQAGRAGDAGSSGILVRGDREVTTRPHGPGVVVISRQRAAAIACTTPGYRPR